MDDMVDLLSTPATSRRINKNTILLCQGDTPQRVYIVQTGCVKVYRIGSNGSEQIAGFKTAGDIFPEFWALGHSTTVSYYYETVEKSTILTLDRDSFQTVIADNPAQKEKLFNYVVKSCAGLLMQLSALEQSSATDKILLMLYYMMVRHGVEKKPGQVWVLMQLNQTTLAGLTGLTRETVTAEMVKLKRRGVVKYDLKNFVIYKEPLRLRIGENSILEVQF